MRRKPLLSAAIVLLVVLGAVALTEDTPAGETAPPRVRESRAVVKDFATRLKGELQAAMKAGGPLEAIEVCNLAAPAIAGEASRAKGWRVGRTSLKPRNRANAPDAWETAVLEAFERRRTAGEDPAGMEHWAVVEADDGTEAFRYMKAIPTAEICTTCHGTDLEPALAAKIDSLYPDDRARGFSLGDIRGAFTIVQPME